MHAAEGARRAAAVDRDDARMNARFQEGVSTQLELLDARPRVVQANGHRAQAERDLQVTRLRFALLPALPFASTTLGAATAAAPSAAVPPSDAASTTPARAGATAP